MEYYFSFQLSIIAWSISVEYFFQMQMACSRCNEGWINGVLFQKMIGSMIMLDYHRKLYTV